MQEATQAKVKSLQSNFDKLASMANPKHSPKFLEAVRLVISIRIEVLSMKHKSLCI